MNEKISVIVPIYNVENYLDRCIESIVNQTYSNLEIILIDDGSPDNCPQMCDRWSEKDNRIVVVHKSNGGLSDARNVGLTIATGEYIAFVDSDDWIHAQYVEYLYKAIKEYKVDLAACNIRKVYTDNHKEEVHTPLMRAYSTEEALETLIKGDLFRAVVWNKLYHKNLLCEELFEIGRYHEDEFFTYRVMGKTDKMIYVDAELYYYFQREGSIMNSVSYKHLDALDAYLDRINYLQNKYPKLYKMDKINFCKTCIYFYQEAFKLNDKEKRLCKNRIKEYRRKIKFECSEFKRYSLKEQISIIGSCQCIELLSRLSLLKRKGLK